MLPAQWQRLAALDEAGCGALTGSQLAAFVTSLAAELPALQGLQRHLPPGIYAAIAARKLLFFHGRAGRWASSMVAWLRRGRNRQGAGTDTSSC
jgi:hypothetical protein